MDFLGFWWNVLTCIAKLGSKINLLLQIYLLGSKFQNNSGWKIFFHFFDPSRKVICMDLLLKSFGYLGFLEDSQLKSRLFLRFVSSDLLNVIHFSTAPWILLAYIVVLLQNSFLLEMVQILCVIFSLLSFLGIRLD